jgi:hypothetical protein
VITIDPGVHGSGFARWYGDRLVEVSYGTELPTVYVNNIRYFDDRVVIEVPQVYPGSRSKGNPNHLIKLAFEAGRMVGRNAVETVLPRQWKGTIKKEVMLRRILSKLTDEELAMLKSLKLPKSKEKECIDAIGIGLWKLGRL